MLSVIARVLPNCILLCFCRFSVCDFHFIFLQALGSYKMHFQLELWNLLAFFSHLILDQVWSIFGQQWAGRCVLSHKQHQTSAGCGPHSTLRKCSFIRESGHLTDPQKILLEKHWTLRNTSYVLWWINPGCLPHVHQSQSITSLLSWTGETKCNKRLTGWEKDREIPLTSYYHRQSRFYLRKLVIFITNEVRVV